MNIWSAISSKKFFQGLLDLLRTKDIPEVQMKLLGLIQKWGLNFEDKKNALPNFFSVFNKLRMNNVQFPSDFESNYQIYISENSTKNNYGKNYDDYDDNQKEDVSDKDDDEEVFYYMDSLKNVLKVPNFEHKYRRLVAFLVKMHENIQMANLLIDNREHGGLKDIISTLREGNNTLIDTIQGGRLKDEKLMEITLGTTEDINQTLGREEDIKNGYKPNKFKSYFVINNVIKIKSNNSNNHRSRAKSTKQKKSVQRNAEKYGLENNFYDKNKYKEKMGPKNVDDIFDLFSASNPNNEPQYFQNNNNNRRNNNNMNNNNMNNINNFFNSPQTQQLRNNPMNNAMNNPMNNPMNNFFNNNTNNNINNNNNRNNNTMFFGQNNNQQRPVMTNFDILEQKLNNLNLEQNQNNNYINNNNNQNMPNMQFNQGFNNNNNNNGNNNNNNNLMSMLDQLTPTQPDNSNQLVPYIGSFNSNPNNNMNNMNNNFMNNNNNMNNMNQFNNNNNNNNFNNNFNNFGNNNQYNNNNNINNNRNMFNSQVINRNNNMQINNNQNNPNNQMNMNRINMSQNMGNNNWNNQNNMNYQNNEQMSLEEMEKQKRLKELDDLF